MTINELIYDVLARNVEMTKATVADFSEADMVARPCPGANHTAWQLGHLTNSEVNLVNMVTPGASPALPESFSGKFKKENAKIDDPKFFPPKEELLSRLSSARAATIAWAKTLTDADMSKPAPEPIRGFVPTVGHLVLMMPTHVMMHVGQMQAIRRKLGKPILF